MPLPYHQWYRLVRRKLALCAEVQASRADHRAWIYVRPMPHPREEYPLRNADDHHHGYSVLYYEVEAGLWQEACESWDVDRYILNREVIHVADERELEGVLTRWLDDLERLVDPAFCHSPI